MTRKEHLEFCKRCLNRKMDSKQGIICNLTQKIADFEEKCDSFSIDENVKVAPSLDFDLEPAEVNRKLGAEGIEKLKKYQDFYFAIMGGALTALISAIIWALITVATNYQIGYMAIGVGLLVGYAVQFFGAGIEQKFGFLGAAYALLGCMLGNLLSQVGFIANSESMGYFEVISYLNLSIVGNLMAESFHPMDVLFYGIALFEGYKFGFRKITTSTLERIISGKEDGAPANQKLRMPLTVASILVIGFCVYQVSRGSSGYKKFHYESGKLMSEGEMKNSKEQGPWIYYYENGKKQVEATYNKGIAEGEWKWYNENEQLQKIGHYLNGIEDGLWMLYHPEGGISDSVAYVLGRLEGSGKSWNVDGKLISIGNYHRNQKEGAWTYYYDNGQISSSGAMKDGNPTGKWNHYFADGKPSLETFTDDENVLKYINVWSTSGQRIVTNGTGYYKGLFPEGSLQEEGHVKDGYRVGIWKSYYKDGKPNEVVEWIGKKNKLLSYYNNEGKQLIKEGNGTYESFYADTELLLEKGEVVNGFRTGNWTVYYQTNGKKMIDMEYSDGEVNGAQTTYFESGQISVKGQVEKGKRVGLWTWYYENGNLSSTVEYVNDKKQGIQKMYSEMGGLSKEEEYENGELINETLI